MKEVHVLVDKAVDYQQSIVSAKMKENKNPQKNISNAERQLKESDLLLFGELTNITKYGAGSIALFIVFWQVHVSLCVAGVIVLPICDRCSSNGHFKDVRMLNQTH